MIVYPANIKTQALKGYHDDSGMDTLVSVARLGSL